MTTGLVSTLWAMVEEHKGPLPAFIARRVITCEATTKRLEDNMSHRSALLATKSSIARRCVKTNLTACGRKVGHGFHTESIVVAGHAELPQLAGGHWLAGNLWPTQC